MDPTTLELRPLQVSDEVPFRLAVARFAESEPEFRFAFDYDAGEDFAEYVARLHAWSRGERLPEKHVPNTYLVGMVDGQVAGRVSLRHELNEWLSLFGGHIGYGVVASYRNRGVASRMLKMALPFAAALGIEEVLVTCDDGNAASQRVIEKCGGRFENAAWEPRCHVTKKRYWIPTAGAAPQ